MFFKILILVSLLVCQFTSAFGNPLIGTWVMRDKEITIIYTFTENTFIAVKEKDLGVLGKQSWKIEGEYTIAQDKVIMKANDGQRRTHSFFVKGDTLNLNGVIYVRVGEKKGYTPQFEEQAPEVVLVEGNPPLRQKIINFYYRFFEFLTKTSLTEKEKAEIKKYLVDEFRKAGREKRKELLSKKRVVII